MNSSPIKTRRGGVSPLRDQMLDQSQELEQGQELEQQPEFNYEANVGGVTEDNNDDNYWTEKFSSNQAKYDEDVNFATEKFGNESLENIIEELSYENLEGTTVSPNFENPIESLNNVGTQNDLLGTGYDFKFKNRWVSKNEDGSNVRKQQFMYGDITTVTSEDSSEVETIRFTSKNHPLYGKTYIRTSYINEEKGTQKPFNDLLDLFEGYKVEVSNKDFEEYGDTTEWSKQTDFRDFVMDYGTYKSDDTDHINWDKKGLEGMKKFVNRLDVDENKKGELLQKIDEAWKRFDAYKMYDTQLKEN